MSRSASYHPLAEIELNDAALYYEQASPGLGLAFIEAVERCIGAIQEHPHAGSPLDEVVRRRLVETFPYGVLYRVIGDRIRVLAIMNLKRRPFYWAGRR